MQTYRWNNEPTCFVKGLRLKQFKGKNTTKTDATHQLAITLKTIYNNAVSGIVNSAFKVIWK